MPRRSIKRSANNYHLTLNSPQHEPQLIRLTSMRQVAYLSQQAKQLELVIWFDMNSTLFPNQHERQDVMQKLVDLEQEEKRNFTSLQTAAITDDPALSLFVKVDKICSDKDYPHAQALENVLSIYRNLPLSLIYYIKSDGEKVSFYLGVRPQKGSLPRDNLRAYAQMLENSLKGNFRGTVLQTERNGTTSYFSGSMVCRDLLTPHMTFSAVLGVPSQEAKADDYEFQSLDHVIHSMNGRPFHIVISWESLSAGLIQDMQTKVNGIYNAICPLTANNITHSTGSSTSDVPQERAKKTNSTNEGSSNQYQHCDKRLLSVQKYIDDELLVRLRSAKAKGFYHTAVYLGAESIDDLALLEASFTSVFQSEKPAFVPLTVKRLPKETAINKLVASGGIYKDLQATASWLDANSRWLYQGKTSIASCLTIKELSLIAGFPRTDVPGLEVSSRVSFGLNLPASAASGMDLGQLLQDGGELQQRLRLPPEDLERHVFVAGTTGSGKTTTCQRILKEFGGPFMVIEPAKTEYRSLINIPSMKDVLIFTVGRESGVPFRMNPFEFLPSENISSHIDMLKACFMSSFEMEAAMPNLLEEAMYRVYERFGWDISTNGNRYLGTNVHEAWQTNSHGLWFPTISDYIVMVEQVVNSKNFGDRLQGEYLGSLIARLNSLKEGVKGRMLNTRLSIDFAWLLNKKVVIELEELKSGDDKSFVMALIVTRLIEALKAKVKAEADNGGRFQHVLLIEEAHRLLSRIAMTGSNSRRLGVEILTDMLAEVRKYHESLIIVDQIPSKLASDVLKNTNTKIVHRLFADDDKEAIGDAIALSKKQTEFISQLGIGEAIVSGNGWNKPVHARIAPIGDTSQIVGEEQAFANGRMFWRSNVQLFCSLYPIDGGANPSPVKLQSMLDIEQQVREFIRSCRQHNQALHDPSNRQGDAHKDLYETWQNLLAYAQRVIGAGASAFMISAIISAFFLEDILKAQAFKFDARKTLERGQKIALLLTTQTGDTEPRKLFNRAMIKL